MVVVEVDVVDVDVVDVDVVDVVVVPTVENDTALPYDVPTPFVAYART